MYALSVKAQEEELDGWLDYLSPTLLLLSWILCFWMDMILAISWKFFYYCIVEVYCYFHVMPHKMLEKVRVSSMYFCFI